jgi:hypothetical protein
LFWLEAGDMLLDFAFEDQHLYELATVGSDLRTDRVYRPGRLGDPT